MSHLDSKMVEVGEELVIPSEYEEGESVEVGKYAAIKKAGMFEGLPVWSVEEVSAGFKTSDPLLKEMVDNYVQGKNESEFLELSQQKEIEALIYYDRDNAERRMRAINKLFKGNRFDYV